MTRTLFKVVFLFILVVTGSIGIAYYREHFSAEHTISDLQNRNQQLKQIVQRLGNERRVAELLVTDQKTVNGVTQTTLLWQERARDGSGLPPKMFTIEGKEVHIDALVIKFDHDSVQNDEPLRGHSIALFTRLYGSHQSPDQGFPINSPGQIPDYYRGADPQVQDFETKLWTDFWHLASDASYQQQQGVRVANGQGIWDRAVEVGKLYTITVETDGGINYSIEPIPAIYQQALQKKGVM